MASRFLYVATCILLATSVLSSPIVFRVGGPRGWMEPMGNETETYNHWATRNRFHVGDYLYFKYVNDSVLVVSHDDYKLCSTAKPLFRFADGETKFRFDRYGFFYFISGEPGHCELGERLIVRVMVHPEPDAGPAPAPVRPPTGSGHSGSGSGSGSSSSSSAPAQSSAAFRHMISGYSLVGVLVGALSVLVLV